MSHERPQNTYFQDRLPSTDAICPSETSLLPPLYLETKGTQDYVGNTTGAIKKKQKLKKKVDLKPIFVQIGL